MAGTPMLTVTGISADERVGPCLCTGCSYINMHVKINRLAGSMG
jgi:hypothetical protein